MCWGKFLRVPCWHIWHWFCSLRVLCWSFRFLGCPVGYYRVAPDHVVFCKSAAQQWPQHILHLRAPPWTDLLRRACRGSWPSCNNLYIMLPKMDEYTELSIFCTRLLSNCTGARSLNILAGQNRCQNQPTFLML